MTTDPQTLHYLAIGLGITALSTLLGLVAQLVTVWRGIRGSPERRSVTIENEFATKSEHRDLKAHIEKVEQATADFRREVHHELAMVTAKGEERAAKIHERINDLGQSITGQVGQLNGTIAMLIKQ